MIAIFVKNFIAVSVKDLILIAETALRKNVKTILNLIFQKNYSNQTISNFVKKNLFGYFQTSDLTNLFFKMDINFIVKGKMNLEIINNFNDIKKAEDKKTKKQKIKYNKLKKHINYFKL